MKTKLKLVPIAPIDGLSKEMQASLEPQFEAIADTHFTAGFEDGAKIERERIQAVENVLLPGHEKLIADLKFDGKTTGPEAAVQIVKAENEKKASKLKDIRMDAPKAVEHVAAEEVVDPKKDAKKVDANELAKEAKTYHDQQHALQNKISMIEATEFVYKRAGVPTR
jgi:hypothetical protein